MEDRGWRIEDRGWRLEDGDLKMETPDQSPRQPRAPLTQPLQPTQSEERVPQPETRASQFDESLPTPLHAGTLRKMTIAITLVLAVGSLAYLSSKQPEPPGRQNLINVSVADSDVDLVLTTSVASDVEHYIRESFGIQVKIPAVRNAGIAGAGALGLRDGVSIPTIEFTDPDGDIERLLVFTYAMLDSWEFAFYLDRAVRLELEHDRSFAVVNATDGREVILWRSGDDIYLAVAENGASRLISRIRS